MIVDNDDKAMEEKKDYLSTTSAKHVQARALSLIGHSRQSQQFLYPDVSDTTLM